MAKTRIRSMRNIELALESSVSEGGIRANKSKPFFLYLPYTLVHAELWVPEQYEKPFIDRLGDPEKGP